MSLASSTSQISLGELMLNGKVMKERRVILGLSLGMLAKQLGV